MAQKKSTSKKHGLPAHLARSQRIFAKGNLLVLPILGLLSLLLLVANRQDAANSAEYLVVLVAPFALPALASPLLIGLGLYLLQYIRGRQMITIGLAIMLHTIAFWFIINSLL